MSVMAEMFMRTVLANGKKTGLLNDTHAEHVNRDEMNQVSPVPVLRIASTMLCNDSETVASTLEPKSDFWIQLQSSG